ncbi:hypothetical protein BGX38DRAFT_1212234, partial [Terfezia claveryi]
MQIVLYVGRAGTATGPSQVVGISKSFQVSDFTCSESPFCVIPDGVFFRAATNYVSEPASYACILWFL